jgi:D-alanine-D-alanine ligase
MNRKSLKGWKIGVLMGGTSSEREVSLKSGSAIYRALKSLKYHVNSLDVGDDICAVLKKKKIDAAFIALHGGHGENGALQGMLEVMNIPYTGSGILASALAMDKEASKKMFLYHGLPVPPFVVVSLKDFKSIFKKEAGSKEGTLKTGFPLPWVVKPVSEGSSIGVEIVKSASSLKGVMNKAFSYGGKVIVEKFIDGREVQIGILNDKVLGGVEVKPSLEFYNYEAKYTAGLTEYILPPKLGRKIYERAKRAALSAHIALGCSGATRVDLIIDRQGNPYVLEVNTIPGMTETSLLPKIARSAGLSFPALLEEILGGIK